MPSSVWKLLVRLWIIKVCAIYFLFLDVIRSVVL